MAGGWSAWFFALVFFVFDSSHSQTLLYCKDTATISSTLAVIALFAFQFLKIDALATVVSHGKDLAVVTGRTFNVEWTNSGNNTQFEIDLFHRKSETQSHENGCGTFVTMLCKHGEYCVDESGHYDAIIPEPLHNLSESGYVVGVKSVCDDSYGCSKSSVSSSPKTYPKQTSIL